MASKVQTSDNQEINEISVYFLNRISLFLLLPMSIAPFIGLHLYTYGIWMSFCLMAVGLIQLLCIIPLSIQSRFGKPIAFDLKFINSYFYISTKFSPIWGLLKEMLSLSRIVVLLHNFFLKMGCC